MYSKVKCTVFRKEGGLYTPKTNEIEFIIEAFDEEVVHVKNILRN